MPPPYVNVLDVIADYLAANDSYDKAELVGVSTLAFPADLRTATFLKDLTAEAEQGRLAWPIDMGLAHGLPRLLQHHDVLAEIRSLAGTVTEGRPLVLE